MKNIWTIVVMLGLCASLGACGATKEKLGLNKKAPNEFMVSPRAPLSLPPQYDLVPVTQPETAKSVSMDEALSEDDTLSGADKKLINKMGK